MEGRTTGQYLKSVRLQLGCSQVEMAAILGVSNVSVNRWEHDRVQPDARILERYRILERNGLDQERLKATDGVISGSSGNILGRDQELHDLGDLLGRHSVVTILGTCGAGKTRLALALGDALRARYSDGVWFADLSPLVDGSHVGHLFLKVFGLNEPSRKSASQRIAELLGGTRVLLILDNCEHLIPACAEIVSAVAGRGGPGRVLATSRVPLDIAGESLFPIPPLLDTVAEELLVSRVRERRPGYDPDDRERDDLRMLCARLDFLPLAIELAAARMQVLSARQILDRLDRRFDLLQVPGGKSSRQRTLAAAIGWSCDLLNPAEASLFRLLGVFSGWFDLKAIEAVSGDSGVDLLLERLVAHSLVVVEHSPGSDGPRYRLLDSLAAYARRWSEQLVESEDARVRHATYFRQIVAVAASGLHGPRQSSLFVQIDLIYENVTSALTWALASGQPDFALSIANALESYWQRRGRYTEGCGWIEQVLTSGPDLEAAGTCSLLVSHGVMLIWLGEFDHAARQLQTALDHAQIISDRGLEARALDAMGLLQRSRGELEEALQHHSRSASIAAETGDVRTQAMALINTGHISNLRGRHADAEQAYMSALELLVGRGDVAAESAALANLGEVASRMSRHEDALIYTERALILARELGDPDRVAILLANEAESLMATGDPATALARASEAATQFRRTGSRSYLAGTLYLLGLAQSDIGGRVQGLTTLREALRIYHDLEDWLDVAFTIEAISRLFLLSDDAERATRWLGGAAAIRRESGSDPYPLFGYEDLLTKARASLGNRFMDHWSDGENLPAPRLVVEVLHAGRVTDGFANEVSGNKEPIELLAALTPRQIEILTLASEGLSNREIALRLSISPRTVERHLTAVYTSFGVERRSSAVALAIDSGLKSFRRS